MGTGAGRHVTKSSWQFENALECHLSTFANLEKPHKLFSSYMWCVCIAQACFRSQVYDRSNLGSAQEGDGLVFRMLQEMQYYEGPTERNKGTRAGGSPKVIPFFPN